MALHFAHWMSYPTLNSVPSGTSRITFASAFGINKQLWNFTRSINNFSASTPFVPNKVYPNLPSSAAYQFSAQNCEIIFLTIQFFLSNFWNARVYQSNNKLWHRGVFGCLCFLWSLSLRNYKYIFATVITHSNTNPSNVFLLLIKLITEALDEELFLFLFP